MNRETKKGTEAKKTQSTNQDLPFVFSAAEERQIRWSVFAFHQIVAGVFSIILNRYHAKEKGIMYRFVSAYLIVIKHVSKH